MNLHLPLPVLAAALALLAGCGSPGTSVGSPGAGSPGTSSVTATRTGPDRPELVGRTFASTRVTVDGTAHPLVPGTRITVGFTVDQIAVKAGCNTISGRVRIDGSTVRPIGSLMTTAMPCPSALSTQDQWLMGLFSTGVQIGHQDGLLTLTQGGTTITLRDQQTATPDASLVMTQWMLATIVQGDVARSVPAGAPSTLVFGSGLPKAFIDTGCNTGSAEVGITPDRITFTETTLTGRGCDGEAALLEATVRDVLQGTVEYHLKDRLLTLSTGTTSLVYRAG